MKLKLDRWLALILTCLIIFSMSINSVLYTQLALPNTAKAIIVAGSHFVNVPFYYQEKTYYCGPAALQMVFDYFGENISQLEIADVARTIPYVTYTDELRRAAHFSDMSTSMGSEMLGNITGYTARKLGYAAFEMFGMTLDDLKALIDRDFPVILLMRWIPGEPYGHYRVAVGYNATHVFLHDPWNNVLWGGDYGGPYLPMNYTFFNEMWDYSGYWGLFVSPWNVNIEMPSNVYVGQTFTITATVFYVCPQTFIYNYEASSCNATITLPEGIVLADGESPKKSLKEIYAGGRAQTSWRVKAKRPGNYSIFVEVEGKITGFVVEKAGVGPSYQYEDRIGGSGSSFVNVEYTPQIYIDNIKPAKGTPGTEAFILGGGATPNGTVVALLNGPVNQTIVIIGSQSTKVQENITVIVNMTLGWAVADADGFWSIPFTVPDVQPGEYNIFVLDNFTQTSDVAKFYILPLTPIQIKIENVSPVEGYPNTLVFIAGHGATPKGEVKIYFDQLNVANTIAYDDGGWLTTFNVPDVSPGNYMILALDVASNTSDTVIFKVLEMAQRSVGVKEGDWAKYDLIFNYSTNDPTIPIQPILADIDYLLIRIVSVVRTNVTYEYIVRYKNGTEEKAASWLDITTGITYYGITMPYGPIIAANLTAGDKVYLNAYAPTINLTSIAFYAGLQREVNSLLIKTDTNIPGYYRTVMDFEIHWDRISGILCKQKMNASYTNIEKGYETSMFLQMVVTETNIWIKPITPVMYVFNVTWEDIAYPITVFSNSTITNFTFNQTKAQITLSLEGFSGSKGYFNITIPKDLLRGPWSYMIDGKVPLILEISEGENATCSFIYFLYVHTSTFKIIIRGTYVIPEFELTPNMLLILIFNTLMAAFSIRKIKSKLQIL